MNIKKRTRIMISTGLIGISSLSTLAHGVEGSSVERAIEYRQALMTLFAWNMKPMGSMMKGKIPFDKTAFKRHAQDLESVAKLDLLAGFPEDSEGEESDALADIWLDFEDFKQKYGDLKTAASALSQAAESGDQASIEPAFGALNKACKACHKAYKN